jgi:predicted NUDIX family phosphoesterase
LILDRGIFDSICWLNIMERTARIRKKEKKLIADFLLLDDWKKRISGVVVMNASPKDSMEREKGLLPTEGNEGSIMNERMLSLILDTTNKTADEFKSDFRIFQISTSDRENTPQKTAEKVADFVLNIIEEQLQETVLTLPKRAILELFKGGIRVQTKEASDLVNLFLNNGKYELRIKIEDNGEQIQALPVLVVRNKQGAVLKLRRKEKTEKNPLHGEVVIWAGGHVREEDSTNGDAIVHCLLRELHEELRLSVEPRDLKLLGSIFSDTGRSTSKHVAIVYEWRTNRDDVDLALCTSEFFERTGTSLSGKFVNLEELVHDVNIGKISEVWSEEIIRSFLTPGEAILQKGLF